MKNFSTVLLATLLAANGEATGLNSDAFQRFA